MARIYATLITPGIGVYRPSDHPVWEWAQVRGRLRKNLALVDRNDPRSMLKALMKNMPIWYAPDQDYGRRVSTFAPFFAVKEAATVEGTHNLARVKTLRCNLPGQFVKAVNIICMLESLYKTSQQRTH